jgi:hypothetical protein
LNAYLDNYLGDLMRKLLMLQPMLIYKRWPMPYDFTRLFMSSLTLSFAQLRSQLKNYEVDYIDGSAEECSLKELTRRAKACDVVLINAFSSVGALNVEANLRHIMFSSGLAAALILLFEMKERKPLLNFLMPYLMEVLIAILKACLGGERIGSFIEILQESLLTI